MGQFAFSLDNFLPYKLIQTSEQVSESLATLYKREFDITRSEWRIIANLAARENVIARDLSEITNLDKVKVSRTLINLEDKKLIQRAKSENDLRASNIKLTKEGLSLYQRIVPLAIAWESQILDGLTATQYRDLCQTLDALSKSVATLTQLNSE
ncbi:MarR family winged helix-turn-helix transcriptional regulator [Photobacterium sp. 1_MG-2023]|uniref:MarR family winged helix-turn-helix transcriptional regulator n=1 Tax=Photobacterium sp. 1_MG-2023 TaxID=3062646 RepID=UPI0026E19108|nr:MarR family transcriptional regulator [Photobacterium sp. 1_MG-2023]MDO6708339.1 MarR family transcriptional regulator [Photobacterium sp. 1_MG-2023]